MLQELMPIILIIIIICMLFGYKKSKQYFLWIENTKDYKPLNLINKLLLVASIVLPLIHNTAINSRRLTVVDAVLFFVPLGIIVLCNLAIRDIKHIIIVTILQIIFGYASIIVSIVVIVIAFSSGSYTGKTKAIPEYDSRMAMIKASWLGKELDYARASKLGFSSPEEAMEQGYMYNGDRIYDSKI